MENIKADIDRSIHDAVMDQLRDEWQEDIELHFLRRHNISTQVSALVMLLIKKGILKP